MEYTHLGRRGVSVSRLCLGTMNFGAATGEADAQPIMDAAHENGINFLRHLEHVRQAAGRGVTEAVVGRWLAAGSGRRDRTGGLRLVIPAFRGWLPVAPEPW